MFKRVPYMLYPCPCPQVPVIAIIFDDKRSFSVGSSDVTVATETTPLIVHSLQGKMEVPPTIFVANNSCREESNNDDNTNNNNTSDDNGSSLGSGLTKTTSSSVVPSYNYSDAAYDLTRKRELEYDTNINPDQQPRPVDDVWRDIVLLLQEPFRDDETSNSSHLNANAGLTHTSSSMEPQVPCPQALKDVMNGEYELEQHFSQHLFGVLRDCLAEHDLLDDEYAPNHLLVSKLGRCNGYAMGIAREANDGEEEKSHANERASASATAAADDKLDHCACLLSEDDGAATWQVTRCLSALKLKLRTTPPRCAPFPGTTSGRTLARSLDLGNSHGALAQVMSYTMARVLPGLAQLGQLQKEIPWGVVVGNCKSHSSHDVLQLPPPPAPSNRWVSGNIYVPDACGGRFYYAVTGFGGFDIVVTGERNESSVHQALSIYLDTILVGLRAARNFVWSVKKGTPCRAVPTSGLALMIGNLKLDLVFQGNNLPLSCRRGGSNKK